MNISKILLVSLAVLVLLFGCTSKQTGSVEEKTDTADEKTEPPESKAQENPNKNIENAVIGTPYKIKYLNTEYEVVLKEAKFASSNNEYFYKHYVVAFFEIKNIGEDTDFFSPDIYSEDEEREKISRTFAVGLEDDYSKTLSFIEQLNVGQKTSGWVAFEVPESLEKLDVFFEYSNPFINRQPQYIKYEITK
ncbi:MAG: DUF4352 domain-containing protein [archaeon]|nr:DUF4352 domain-containing protein [archaeon]